VVNIKHAANEGIVTWTGGLTGNVEFSGVDYNDMICTYEIKDCETSEIVLNCNGAEFPTTIEVNEDRSILLNSSLYKRL